MSDYATMNEALRSVGLTQKEKEEGRTLHPEVAQFPLGFDPAPAKSGWVITRTTNEDKNLVYTGAVEVLDFNGMKVKQVIDLLKRIAPESDHEKEVVVDLGRMARTDRLNASRLQLDPDARVSKVSAEDLIDKAMGKISGLDPELASRLAAIRAEIAAKKSR